MDPAIPEIKLVVVSMYVNILSSALEEWVAPLSGAELVAYAIQCRKEMRAIAPCGVSAYAALASEVAYDRALIALCAEHGIAVDVTRFNNPSSERQHLEERLAHEGVDLDAPVRDRINSASHAS